MIKKLVDLIFEWFHLKQIKHEWWRLAWVEFPDSVAEHSCLAAQIGYVLAKMENADAFKVSTILVWHDIAETRIWDHHKVASKYLIDHKKNERVALVDQFQWLDFYEEIIDLFNQYDNQSTKEWIVAKDANYLEMAFQAKIYLEKWCDWAQNWLDNIEWALKTESAKKLFNELLSSKSTDWWLKNSLKKLPSK